MSQTNRAGSFKKKFVILKDSNTICFDNGEGRIQVYNWKIEALLEPKTIIFTKTCSLRDHQIAEVLDSNLVSVLDFQFNGKTKLFNVKENKISDTPFSFDKFTNNSVRSRTFSSIDYAFSLSKTEQSLSFHFNNFVDSIEIINHDCMDFVFYMKREVN